MPAIATINTCKSPYISVISQSLTIAFSAYKSAHIVSLCDRMIVIIVTNISKNKKEMPP